VIIIGIDPGTIVTGYGVIEISKDGRYRLVDYGCIRPPQKYPLHDRYLIIHQGTEELLEKFSPDILVIETQYFDKKKNPQSAIKIGMARGVIIVAARKKSIPIAEYSPSVAKRAVTGKGGASKEQVQWMIQKLLALEFPPHPKDAADALALAICHAQRAFRPVPIPSPVCASRP